MKSKVMVQYKLTVMFDEYAGSLQTRFNAFVFGVLPDYDGADYESYARQAVQAYKDNSIDIADVATLLSYFENGNKALSAFLKGIFSIAGLADCRA